jgi:hypothetical protein
MAADTGEGVGNEGRHGQGEEGDKGREAVPDPPGQGADGDDWSWALTTTMSPEELHAARTERIRRIMVASAEVEARLKEKVVSILEQKAIMADWLLQAFIAHTGLTPDRIALNSQYKDGKFVYWFEGLDPLYDPVALRVQNDSQRALILSLGEKLKTLAEHMTRLAERQIDGDG